MKSVLVTGATRGIGKEAFERFRKEHGIGRVVGVARTLEDNKFTDGSQVLENISADLGTKDGIDKIREWIRNDKEGIDILVNNAGELGVVALDNIEIEDIESSNRLHLLAPILLAREVAIKNNPSNKIIINIGSIYGRIADENVAGYVLAKSMMTMATKIIARAFGPKVRANVILPGHIDTDMTRGAPEEFITSIIEKTPVGKIGKVDDVVEAIMYLASEKAEFISGAEIVIDGGFEAR